MPRFYNETMKHTINNLTEFRIPVYTNATILHSIGEHLLAEIPQHSKVDSKLT